MREIEKPRETKKKNEEVSGAPVELTQAELEGVAGGMGIKLISLPPPPPPPPTHK